MMQSAVMERKEMRVTRQGRVILLGVPWLRGSLIGWRRDKKAPLLMMREQGGRPWKLSPTI